MINYLPYRWLRELMRLDQVVVSLVSKREPNWLSLTEWAVGCSSRTRADPTSCHDTGLTQELSCVFTCPTRRFNLGLAHHARTHDFVERPIRVGPTPHATKIGRLARSQSSSQPVNVGHHGGPRQENRLSQPLIRFPNWKRLSPHSASRSWPRARPSQAARSTGVRSPNRPTYPSSQTSTSKPSSRFVQSRSSTTRTMVTFPSRSGRGPSPTRPRPTAKRSRSEPGSSGSRSKW